MAAVSAVVCLALAACAGSSSGTSSSPTPASSTGPGGPGGFNAKQLAAVRSCLKAAGIKVPKAPRGFPSGLPSNLPSGLPTNFPSGATSFGPGQQPPSGFPGGGRFNTPAIRNALKACGISLPTPNNG